MPRVENIPPRYSLYNYFTRPQCQRPLALMEVYNENPNDATTTETRTFCANNGTDEEKTDIPKESIEAQTTTISPQGESTRVPEDEIHFDLTTTFVAPEYSIKTQDFHESVASVSVANSVDEQKENPPNRKNAKKRISLAKNKKESPEYQTMLLSKAKQKRTSGRLKKNTDIKQQTLINFGTSVALQSKSSQEDLERLANTGSGGKASPNILEDTIALDISPEEKYAQLPILQQEFGKAIEDHTSFSDNSKKPIHPFFEKRKFALAEPKEPSQQDFPKTSLNEDSTLISSTEPLKPTHPFFLRTSEKNRQSPPLTTLTELNLLKYIAIVNDNAQAEENISPSISIFAKASKELHPFFQPRSRTSTPLIDTDGLPLPETTFLQHPAMVEALWPDKDIYAGGHVQQSEHSFGRLHSATVEETEEMNKKAKEESKEFWQRALQQNGKLFGDMRDRKKMLQENLATEENWNMIQRQWTNVKLNPEELEIFLKTIWENEQYKTGPYQHLYDALFESIKYQQIIAYPNSNTLSWTDKYKPTTTNTFLGNLGVVIYLRDWLKEMKVSPIIPTTTSVNLEEEKPKKRERKSNKLIKKRKRAGYILDDFIASDSESGDDQFERVSLWDALNSDDDFFPVRDPVQNRGLYASKLSPPSAIVSNMIVLTGPNGVGKTAAVYACAAELEYEVFEIHPGMLRSRKEILAIVGEMAESHLVTFGDTSITTSLSVTEAVIDKDNDVNITCLYDKNSDQTMKISASSLDSKINPFAKLERDAKLPLEETPPFTSEIVEAHAQFSDNQQYTHGTVVPKQSLILLEEVDVLFEEDRTFWSGVLQLAQKSKRPIVMTCNDQTLLPTLCLQGILDFSIIPTADLVLYLHLICLVEGHFVNPGHLQYLVEILHHDLRRILLTLEFWTTNTPLIKNISIPKTIEPGTALDSLTMNGIKRKNDKFENEGDIGTPIKKQRQVQEHRLHENDELRNAKLRLFSNKCDLLSDYLGTKSAECTIKHLIRLQHQQQDSDFFLKESIALASVEAWVQVVGCWREYGISLPEILGIWSDLEVIHEENMPKLVDRTIIDKAAMPEPQMASAPFSEKVFDFSTVKLPESDNIILSPEGLNGPFDINKLGNSEENEGDLRSRRRPSSEELIQHRRVANQLINISHFLDDVSFANAHVAMSQNRFSQVHELDTYIESEDSLIGHTNLWKSPNGYDHWQMEDEMEGLLTVLARKACNVANINTELIVDNKTSLKSELQVAENVRSSNFSKVTSSLTPFLTDRTLSQNLCTDGILYHRSYIRLICQLDEDRINGVTPIPYETRRTRSKTYRKHFSDIQLEDMTAILEARLEAKTLIENPQLKDLRAKFQQFLEKQDILTDVYYRNN